MTTEENASSADFDFGAASDEVAESLGVAEPEASGAETESPPSQPSAPEGATTEASAPTATESEATPPPSESAEGPPDSWTKSSKEAWSALPEPIRQEIRKREGDFAKGIGQYKQMATIGQEYVKLIEPFKGTLQQMNLQPSQFLPQVLQAYTIMAKGAPEQKVEMFRALARDAGIDITKLGEAGAAAANGEISALQARIKELETGVTRVASEISASRGAELERAALAFAQDEAKHPYFWDVVMDMKRLIETGAAQGLDDAYESAVWTNPVVRAKEIDRIAAEKAAKAAKEAREHAEKARKASAVKVQSSGPTTRASGGFTGDLDATLAETLAAIESRG